MEHQDTVEIIVGTYDEFLLGFKVGQSDKNKPLKTLIATFSVRSHTSSIRTLTIGGKYLATGGADDKIFIYDMKQRKEINLLLHHFNVVNALTFTPDCTHLLSGGSDGRMYVTRVGNWMVGAEWKKAHGGSAITNIACHSSSKLAMSLGSDLTLRTWNLVTGRCAFVTNLKTKKNLQNMADCLSYSPESKYFAMSGNRVVEIWDIFEAKIIKEISFTSRPISICWLTEDILVVGLESGKLALISIDEYDVQYFDTKSRIKSIAYVNNILATAESNGDIIIWSVDLESKTVKKIASHNIGCRPTCIALLDLNQFDEHYQLNKITDSLSDEEIETEKQLNVKLNKKKSNKITGSVTIEYDNDNENKSNLSTSNEEKCIIKSRKLKTKKKKKKNVKGNSSKNISDNKVLPLLRTRNIDSVDDPNVNKEKITNIKEKYIEESSRSSDDEPLKKKSRTNYVTPINDSK